MLVLAAFIAGAAYGILNYFGSGRGQKEEPYFGETQVIEKDYFDAFAWEVAALVKEYDGTKADSEALSEPYFSRRLVVQGTGANLDLNAYGAKVVIHGPDDLYVMQFTTREAAQRACDKLQEAENIEYCEPDRYSEASEDETYEAMSWGVERIGADTYARKISHITDKSITVAVVDTGVYEHSFLKDRIVSYGCDFVDNDYRPDDKHSHGTHVAGTIVDCTQGLNVRILPVRVLNENNEGSNLIVSLGIRYAVNQGAQVINLSLGTKDGTDRTIDNAARYAVNRGCIVVAAAGNDTRDTANVSPAHLDECIVVSAVDDNLSKADFSNYGNSVDFAAPGVGIISCAPRFFLGRAIGGTTLVKNGTSMAAPHISALAAMIKAEHPDMSPSDIQEVMKVHCIDLGAAGRDPYYGWGIPDFSQEAEEPGREGNTKETEEPEKLEEPEKTEEPEEAATEAATKAVTEAAAETEKKAEEPDRADVLEGYRAVLEEYRRIAENRFLRSVWEQGQYANEGVMNFSLEGFSYNVYYRLADLAGDGEPELLISINEEGEPVNIVDIFGMENGKPVALIESNEAVGYRSRYYITTDNRVKNISSGGALNTAVSYYRLASNSTFMELEDQYIYDGWDGDQVTHTDSSGSSTGISFQEYKELSSDKDVDFGGEWILLYDGQTRQGQPVETVGETEKEEEIVPQIPIRVIKDHDSTSAEAYQGIFMNGDVFIGIALYTDTSGTNGALGIVYRMSKPFINENGYISSDVLETVGEIYDAEKGYEIRGEGKTYGLSYQLGEVTVTDHPAYSGTYTQVSNTGANMDPSEVWLKMPEESGNTEDTGDTGGTEDMEDLPVQFAPDDSAETAEYILPDSSSALITGEQLAGLSAEELRIARNEIYARHGRMFNSSELQQYFNSQSWYVPRYTPEEFEKIQYEVLSDTEWENIKRIQKAEEG